MNETTLNLINAIAKGDALETEQAFQTAMAEKISAKLEDMRVQVAKNMFATQEEVVEEETETITLEEYEALSEEEKANYEVVELEEGVVNVIKKIGGAVAGVAKGAVNAVGKTVGLAAKTVGAVRQTPTAVKNAYNKGRDAAEKSIAG